MSRIKEEMLGYDHEPSDWIEESAHVMVDELIEYQVYCMTLSELTVRVVKQMRDEYYTNSYDDMIKQYKEAFPNEQM